MSTNFPKKALAVACSLGLLVAGGAAQAATCSSLLAIPANAGNLCIEDNNAAFLVDPTLGVNELNVDDNQHLWYQDFFYDDLTNGSDFTGMYNDDLINGYPSYAVDFAGSTTSGSTLSLFYEPEVGTKNNQLGNNLPWVQIDFTLTGGATGSDTSTIVETFTITNKRNVAMTVDLFAYTDVDLNIASGGVFNPGEEKNDMGELVDASLTKYRQFDANYEMLATVNIPVDGYRIGHDTGSATLLDLFAPGMGDLTLGTGDAGPWLDEDCGDFADLFCTTPGANLEQVAQWNRTLAAAGSAGDSFSYMHTLTLAPIGGVDVPIPAALPLALSGLGLLGVAGRRKKKAAANS